MPSYVLAVFALFMATNLLNFMLIGHRHRRRRRPVADRPGFRHVYLPVLPVEFATGLLTAGVAFAYGDRNLAAIGLLAVIGLVFQYLLRTALSSIERKDQLEGRTRQLAALQVGVLGTVLQTLSLRDKMTARHSAAVARYSREIALELGLSEREQEIVHTAGLLHDIGKFIFPDSILFAETRLTDEQFAIVRRHPEQGAKLVKRIEGYGPIAEIILAHHERIDGRGYPNGLAGEEIPLAARIISVSDTYDVMTARDSYRRPVPPSEAIAELRRVSGAQLDGRVVEAFIRVLDRRGRHVPPRRRRRLRARAEPGAPRARLRGAAGGRRVARRRARRGRTGAGGGRVAGGGGGRRGPDGGAGAAGVAALDKCPIAAPPPGADIPSRTTESAIGAQRSNSAVGVWSSGPSP